MSTTTIDGARSAVFELVRFIDGRPVPYVPYQSDCAGCCGAEPEAAPVRSCCHG